MTCKPVRKSLSIRPRVRRLHWLAAAVVAISATGCTAPKSEPEPERAKPPVAEEGVVHIQDASRAFVQTEEVSAATSDSMLTAPARVDFRDGAVSQVGAPLDGRIVTVHVLIGQRIAAGDPLLTMDCPDAAAMRSAAEVAQSALREARLELERQRRMQQEGVGIERDVVAAETKVSAAESELARAEAGAVSIGKGTASAVTVRAPIGGVVISRKASAGMAVQRGGDPLVEIGDTSALWIVADVFERDLSRVHTGATTHIQFPSAEGPLEGRVASVGAIVASSLRTAPVFITVQGRGAQLRPGMYGRVDIAADPGVTLPVDAVLIKDGKDPVVFVQRDLLTYMRRRVVVAQPVDRRVQIVSGVSPGEKVVVRGALLLDGSLDQLP